MSEINYKNTLSFWDQRAQKVGKILDLSVTMFNEDPSEVTRRHELDRDALFSNIDFTRSRTILDLGCGIGRFTIPLAKKSDLVVGVDFSQALLDKAIEKSANEGVTNIDYVCSASQTFRYNAKFDLVVVSGLLLYLNDKEVVETVANIDHHLRDGGDVVVRESGGVDERFEIIDKYSDDLKTRYNAIYRMPDTLSRFFRKRNFIEVISKILYQHRRETAVWLFKFRKGHGSS